MKALTVRQPWASLIIEGTKDVECRSWSHAHRGPLLIHSGQRIDRDALEAGIGRPGLPTGVILGVVDLVDIVAEHHSKWAEPGYSRYFVLENPRPLAEPVPYNGQLGLYDVPDDLVAALI